MSESFTVYIEVSLIVGPLFGITFMLLDLSMVLFLRVTFQSGLALVFDDLFVARVGRNGQTLGQQEIAGVAGRDLHDLAASP